MTPLMRLHDYVLCAVVAFTLALLSLMPVQIEAQQKELPSWLPGDEFEAARKKALGALKAP